LDERRTCVAIDRAIEAAQLEGSTRPVNVHKCEQYLYVGRTGRPGFSVGGRRGVKDSRT
jgi:hypothetical protein